MQETHYSIEGDYKTENGDFQYYRTTLNEDLAVLQKSPTFIPDQVLEYIQRLIEVHFRYDILTITANRGDVSCKVNKVTIVTNEP